MTKQESFKRRIRKRMAHTGERYGAARRALMSPGGRTDGHARGWVSEPEQSDATISSATGLSWDDWVHVLDAEGPGRSASHTEIAAWVRQAHGVDDWWSQGVAVGYRRIIGARLPGQMPDGTFTISRSRTLDLDVTAMRELATTEETLFPGLRATLRSRPGTKSLRFTLADAQTGTDAGVLGIGFYPAGTANRVTVTHEKLASPEACEHWKEFWAEWLTVLAESLTP